MAITQILRGDATGAVKAIQDLNKAIDGTEKGYAESTREAKKLESQARRVAEQADPQKKYNRQMEDLARLVKLGKVELSAAELQAKKYGVQLDNSGRVSRAAFGGNAMTQLRNYAAGIASVTAAVSLLKEGLQAVEQAGQQAADNAFTSLGAQGESAQLGPQGAKSVNKFAEELLASGVFAPSQGTQAFDTSFILESAGFSNADKNLIKQIGESRFVRPEKLTEFGGQLRKIQDNLDQQSSIERILDKLVAAAGVTQSNAGAIAGKVPDFATEASALGLNPDEALAGFIAVEAGAPNPDIAATRFKSFLSRLDKSGLTVNNDLTDTLSILQQRINSGEKASDIVPDIRGLAALRTLLDKSGFIGEVEGKIQSSEGAFRSSQDIVSDLSPTFAAGRIKAAEEGRRGVKLGGLSAEGELIYDAVLAARTSQLEDKYGAFGTAAGSIGGSFLDFIAQDKSLRQFSRNEEFREYANPETIRRLDSYLERIARATESTDGKVRSPQPAGRAE